MTTTRRLIALATLALAGTAAMADDITVANDAFVAQHSRAEVRADVLAAKANGSFVAPSEVEATTPAAAASDLTRDQVRAELRATPKARVVIFNDAA